MVGVGSVGNLVAALIRWPGPPKHVGWRTSSLWLLAAGSGLVALGIALDGSRPGTGCKARRSGSLLDLLKMPALWAILPLAISQLCTPAGAVRGLWIGPYLQDVFRPRVSSQVGTGHAGIMGVAMICGTLCYGPLDRLFKTQKWVVFTGNL